MFTVTTIRNGKIWARKQCETLATAKRLAVVQQAEALDTEAYTTVFPSVPAGLPAGTVSTELLFRVDKNGKTDRRTRKAKTKQKALRNTGGIHFISCR